MREADFAFFVEAGSVEVVDEADIIQNRLVGFLII